MNNVTLVGNLCRDFELRKTGTGISVASNTIAVKRDRKEADGTYASDFFDVYCFGAQADYAVKWLRKGDRVAVSGSIHIRDFVMKNGAKGRAVEVSVNSIENQTPKAEEDISESQAEEQVSEPSAPQVGGTPVDLPDDDLPF